MTYVGKRDSKIADIITYSMMVILMYARWNQYQKKEVRG